MPVLELDDGSTLSESIAICRYLEELHPAPALFGDDAWQRAHVEMWIRRIEFALMSRIGAVWINTHKYTAHLGTQYKDFGEASRVRTIKALHWLNDELAGSEFIADRLLLDGRHRRADHHRLRHLHRYRDACGTAALARVARTGIGAPQRCRLST